MHPVIDKRILSGDAVLQDATLAGSRTSEHWRPSGRPICDGLFQAAACLLLGIAPFLACAQGYPFARGGFAAEPDYDSVSDDVLNFVVGGSVAHDSNLFRVSGQAVSPQSDNIGTASIGLRLDKPYAQQRLQLDASVTAYRYDRFSYLDFNALDYRAAWLWHLTPRVSGSLWANRTEMPTRFEDQVGFQRNVRTTESYGLNVDGLIMGGWHAVAGLAHSSSEGENTAVQNEPTYRQDSAEAGVKYLFKSGSNGTVLWRRNEGSQDDRFQNGVLAPGSEDYAQDDFEAKGTWLVSAKSTLAGRVTYLDRRYDQEPRRDFSGTAGAISFRWRPTTTVDVRFSGARVIAPWQSLFSSYRTRDALSLVPTWRATAKTTVSIGLRRTYDDYPTAVAGLPDRKDTTDHAFLGAEWAPVRSLTIYASVLREVRSSNVPFEEFSTTVGQIGGTFAF
jgi:exopolysaccharide biosynthesis operon protein EpsL